MARTIRLRAPAKLNLALAVTGRRPDGYHELRSVFVTVGLADDVRVALHKRLEVRNSAVIEGEDLAARAVLALARASGRDAHAFVQIRKRIPLAAGLGGGSSDAAAVLRGLASLWRVEPDLVRLGAEVGSDVPFFASEAPAALVSGRGDSVQPLPAPRQPLFAVVVRPTLRLRTADVFAEFTPSDASAAPHIDVLARAFESGTVTPDLLRVHAANDLLAAATRRCDAIRSWQEAAGARGVPLFLTGSGPTLFAIPDDRADALRIARILRHAGMRAHAYPLAV